VFFSLGGFAALWLQIGYRGDQQTFLWIRWVGMLLVVLALVDVGGGGGGREGRNRISRGW